jgi:predicted dehydrogenase
MTGERIVRVGVLGAGAWARGAHLPGYKRDARCRIVAIADCEQDRAEHAAREFDIPTATTDARELFARDDIDLIDVCTPSHTHFELAWSALEAGKHVLCEKPVAYDFRDTRRAHDLARRKGLKTKVGLTFRYSPAMRYMRELVAGGFIGTPFIFNGYEQNSQWLDPKNPLRQVDPDADQSILQVSSLEGYGAPIIDLAHLFVGSDLAQVVGTMRNFIPERMVRATGRMMRMNIDDGDIFLGEFANGALCSIQTSFVTVGNYPGIDRSARLRQRRGAHLPARRRTRHLRNAACGEARCGRVPRARGAGALLSGGRQRPGIVANALLRQPGQQLHRRDSRRRRCQRRRFRRWSVGAGSDQRRRAVVPAAAVDYAAARALTARPDQS